MLKIYNELSRRNLLRYVGNSIVFLPFIRALNETQVFGADNAPRRAVFFFYPDGIIPDRFHPAAGPLTSFPEMTQPLARVKDDIILVRDTTYKTGNSHQGGMNYALTGWGDSKPGISIDTYLGERFKSIKPVVRLGIASHFEGGADAQSCSFIAPGQIGTREDNPTKAFRDLFGGAAPVPQPDGSGMMPAPAPATSGLSNASKKSLLDDNLEQIKTLQTKLASIEKTKLTSHLDAIRELERQLQAMDPGKPGNPGTGGGTSAQCTRSINQMKTFEIQDTNYPKVFQQIGNYEVVARMHNEIAIQALACRVTNVILLQHSHSVCTLPWNNGQPGAGGRAHHDNSHYDAEGNIPDHIKGQQYMMNKLADLIEGLGKVKEGDKSLLYNTVVMGFSELGDSAKHAFVNVGVVIGGQGGGYFKTGRCVSGGGNFHNQTLVSILQSFGLNDNTFGDPSVTGPLAALKG